jgi:hypothetical protein
MQLKPGPKPHKNKIHVHVGTSPFRFSPLCCSTLPSLFSFFFSVQIPNRYTLLLPLLLLMLSTNTRAPTFLSSLWALPLPLPLPLSPQRLRRLHLLLPVSSLLRPHTNLLPPMIITMITLMSNQWNVSVQNFLSFPFFEVFLLKTITLFSFSLSLFFSPPCFPFSLSHFFLFRAVHFILSVISSYKSYATTVNQLLLLKILSFDHSDSNRYQEVESTTSCERSTENSISPKVRARMRKADIRRSKLGKGEQSPTKETQSANQHWE